MKKSMVLIFIAIILLLTGCNGGKEERMSKEEQRNKEMRFKDIDELVNTEQINIWFAWKDKELRDDDSYTFILYGTPTNSDQYVKTRIEFTTIVVDGKLGFMVKTNENTWSLERTYQTNGDEFGPEMDCPYPYAELYRNANWKLDSILDDYCIYLDEYTKDSVEKKVSDIEPIDLFELVDLTTGIRFRYSLEVVYDTSGLFGR